MALRIAEFPVGRRADLWAGVGLAASYVGGCDAGELEMLVTPSATHRAHLAHLAQGAAFAAAAHVRSGLPLPPHCEAGVKVLAGVSVRAAAGWTDTALAALGSDKPTLVGARLGDIDRAAATARAAADEFVPGPDAPPPAATDVAAYQAWRAGIRRQWFAHTTRSTLWRPPVPSGGADGSVWWVRLVGAWSRGVRRARWARWAQFLRRAGWAPEAR